MTDVREKDRSFWEMKRVKFYCYYELNVYLTLIVYSFIVYTIHVCVLIGTSGEQDSLYPCVFI